jgi:hypothetical protein
MKNSMHRAAFIALFAVLALTLIFMTRHTIADAHYEVGDFAANSLLIQDAKSLTLLKGNYSRVGFNHPGPAILYVLAAGEVVFHDWLKFVPLGFSGQLIAVCLYSAFWISLIGAMLYRMTKSAFSTTLLVSAFLTAAAWCDYQFFAGPWFPHLYFFPFAAFSVAIARWTYGETDTLYALALSCGFIIDGHVSFVAIAGIMLIAILIGNWRLAKADRRVGPAIASLPYFRANKSKLLRASLLLSLFFIPLVIETILHYPGPIAQYRSYGHPLNSLEGALRFINIYWGGGELSLLLAIALVGLLYFCAQEENLQRMTRGVAIAVIGATAALLFYAIVGIDDLGYKYVGLFYYAAPALALAAGLYCLYERTALKSKFALAAIAIVLGITSVGWKIRKAPEYAVLYNEARVPALVEKMQTLGPAPLVLDLDNRTDWGYIWSTLLGAAAQAKRAHAPLFCIKKNWHVSFTEEAKCTREQIRNGKEFLVAKSGAPAGAGKTAALDFLDLSFYPAEQLVLTQKQTFTIAQNKDVFEKFFLGTGWSGPENEFVWSIGRDAGLLLRATPQTFKKMRVDFGAFLPSDKSTQRVAVIVNDQPAADFVLTANANRAVREIALPAGDNAVIDVQFRIAKPVSPKNAGLSEDPRPLGIMLYGVSIE